jgi:hypothetical protein
VSFKESSFMKFISKLSSFSFRIDFRQHGLSTTLGILHC